MNAEIANTASFWVSGSLLAIRMDGSGLCIVGGICEYSAVLWAPLSRFGKIFASDG